jgi:hypothetical protein
MDEISVSAAAELDGCEYLDLESYKVVAGYGLELRIREHLPQPGYPENPERDYSPKMIERLGPRPEPPATRLFEVRFGEIISFTLTNESYARFPEKPEIFSGNRFRTFTHSVLLEGTRKTSYVSDEHPGPGPLQHFEFICMDDIVDVVSCAPPAISRLNS